MSLTSLIQELAAARNRVAQLEAAYLAELASLPRRFKCRDADELANAIRNAQADTRRREAATASQTRAPKRTASRPAAAQPAAVRDPAANPAPAPEPLGIAAAASTPAPAPVEKPETPAPAPAPLPTGTSLDDPKNFGQMPDYAQLEAATSGSLVGLDRLRTALEFARKVLQTSRVPPAVWREWRKFEQQAEVQLRAASVVPEAPAQ